MPLQLTLRARRPRLASRRLIITQCERIANLHYGAMLYALVTSTSFALHAPLPAPRTSRLGTGALQMAQTSAMGLDDATDETFQSDAGMAQASDAAANLASATENTWHAVGYAADIDGTEPFATRLFGEPIVLYRDTEGEATCVRDLCPHRSAPLSMGEVQDGVLKCFYHGWGFGKEGACVSVAVGSPPAKLCATTYAVAEYDSMLYVWKGNPLTADARKLPEAAAAAADSLVVETTLDYALDWTHVVESFAARPHLHWLHESVAVPMTSLLPLPLTSLPSRSSSSSSSGSSSVSRDGANIVRHTGRSGFRETIHVAAVGPQRTRVLLRQELPAGSSPLLALPGGAAFVADQVKSWNYQVALLDDIKPRKVNAAASAETYFTRWGEGPITSEYGMTSAYGEQEQDNAVGTYGLKKTYVRDTPLACFPPLSRDDFAGKVERVAAAKQSLVAGALSVPAALVTYNTIRPAVAALTETWPSF